MYLEPDEEQRTQQTAVHRTETHPYFDQQLSFPLKPRNLVKSSFVLQVWAALKDFYEEILPFYGQEIGFISLYSAGKREDADQNRDQRVSMVVEAYLLDALRIAQH